MKKTVDTLPIPATNAEHIQLLQKADLYAKGMEYKEIFKLYCVWKSLPYKILKPKKGTTETMDDVLDKLGIDDPLSRELLTIKTMDEFADHYGIGRRTPYVWNKFISKHNILSDIRDWAGSLVKNVIMSMYTNAMSNNPRAFKDRENFVKVIGGWVDKMEVKADESLVAVLKNSLKQDDGTTTDETRGRTTAK